MRTYMHRGVEGRKQRLVGRSVPGYTRQVETVDGGAREEGRETACEPHFPMHLVARPGKCKRRAKPSVDLVRTCIARVRDAFALNGTP